MPQNRLIGAWHLLSVEGRTPDGETSHPLGASPSGRLIYTEHGHMSVILASGERAPFTSSNFREGRVAEKAHAFDTMMAYSGRYELHEDRVFHYPDVAWFPNWVGTAEERFVELSGDILTLSTPPRFAEGEQRRIFLVWQRVRARTKGS
jgi:hypothetical protein